MKNLLRIGLIAILTFTSFFSFSCKHEHNYVKGDVFPASCTEQGYTLYTCSCRESVKRDLTDKTEHVYKESFVEATCIEQMHILFECKICDYSYTNGHMGLYGKHSGIGTCTVCEKDIFELIKKYIIREGITTDSNKYSMFVGPTSNNGVGFTYWIDKNATEKNIINLYANIPGYVLSLSIPSDLNGKYFYNMYEHTSQGYISDMLTGYVTAATHKKGNILASDFCTFDAEYTAEKLASEMLDALLQSFDAILFDELICCKNLGFTAFEI